MGRSYEWTCDVCGEVHDWGIEPAYQLDVCEECWNKPNLRTVAEIRAEVERRLIDIGEIPLRHHDVMDDARQTELEQLLNFIDGKEG